MIAFADALVILALGGLGAVAASGPALVPAAWLAITTPMLVRSDLRSRRLPNALTLPGLGILVFSLVWSAFHDPPTALAAAVATVAAAVVAYVAALTPGLGMGDAKLGTLVVGSVASVSIDLVAVLLAFASLAALAAVMLGTARSSPRRVSRGALRSTTVAFGPCLLLGYWTALVGECLARGAA